MKPDEDVKAPRLFDVRTIERNIRKGLTTRKDYDKYLKSLPDAAEKAATLESAAADEEDFLEDDDLEELDDDEADEPKPETAPV